MMSRKTSASLQRLYQFGVIVLVACGIGGTTAPDVSALSGSYILSAVDGAPLPVPPPAPGSADPCPPAVTDGQLSLLQGPRVPQGYSISVALSRACDLNGIPTDATFVVDDAGTWSSNGNRISFQSSPYNRKGTYQGTVETASRTQIISVPSSGHTYTFRQLDSTRPLSGFIVVNVLDDKGSLVDGTFMVFHSADGVVQRATFYTSASPILASPAPGVVVINIAPPRGYTLAPGQANPVSASVVSGQKTQVTIMLVKSGP